MNAMSLILALGAGITLVFTVVQGMAALRDEMNQPAHRRKAGAGVIVFILFGIVYAYATYMTSSPNPQTSGPIVTLVAIE